MRIFIGEAPGAWLADATRAKVIARRLQPVTREERFVDMRVDGGGQAGADFVARSVFSLLQ